MGRSQPWGTRGKTCPWQSEQQLQRTCGRSGFGMGKGWNWNWCALTMSKGREERDDKTFGFCFKSDWEAAVEGLKTESDDWLPFCKGVSDLQDGSWEDRRGTEKLVRRQLQCVTCSVLSSPQNTGQRALLLKLSDIYKPNLCELKWRGMSWNVHGSLCLNSSVHVNRSLILTRLNALWVDWIIH